ncbi:MAG: ribonuclease HI [Clostridiales bacterium]|nr:ribonuclease HI [Clostridiales bacterium]
MASEVGKKLKEKLIELYNDKEYALGVMVNSKTEENWKLLLDVIEKEDFDSDRIALIALALGETVEQKH